MVLLVGRGEAAAPDLERTWDWERTTDAGSAARRSACSAFGGRACSLDQRVMSRTRSRHDDNVEPNKPSLISGCIMD